MYLHERGASRQEAVPIETGALNADERRCAAHNLGLFSQGFLLELNQLYIGNTVTYQRLHQFIDIQYTPRVAALQLT